MGRDDLVERQDLPVAQRPVPTGGEERFHTQQTATRREPDQYTPAAMHQKE